MSTYLTLFLKIVLFHSVLQKVRLIPNLFMYICFGFGIRLLRNAMSTRSFLRAKRFSTENILFLLFRTVFDLGKMLVEIISKLSAGIFELTMSLRVENSAWWKTTLKFLKPYFHLRFGPVASENFHKGHAQCCKTNRTERKNIFRSVCI